MKSALTVEKLYAFRDHAREAYGLGSLRLYLLQDGAIDLDSLVVDARYRGQGRGAAFMQALVAFADRHQSPIVLMPASSRDEAIGTTSRARLVKFYKRFGFVENKGRHRDFSLRAGAMFREPQ